MTITLSLDVFLLLPAVLILKLYFVSKLTQNCYCNDFSPTLPNQWLLLEDLLNTLTAPAIEIDNEFL